MSSFCEKPAVRTKIIATLGPACAERERLSEMFDAGVDGCRLNFSHGQPAEHEHLLNLVRTLASERDQAICAIGDLAGPKIRLGTFEKLPAELRTGDTVSITRESRPCTTQHLSTTYPGIVDDVQAGQRIYIDDGLIRLLVIDKRPDELICTCTAGGPLGNRKGVNLPDTRLALPALTEKDRRDLAWAINHDLDYVALSFVRTPEDLYELKRLIKQRGGEQRVIVKIEKTEALEQLDELIGNSDAVLVARGDLGVETDLWRVPLIQKDIVARCQRAGVPVIVATQMLQSMVEHPMPTRAEVSDVANAVFEQADAVMLSAETAIGQYPVQAVEIMNRIAGAVGEFLATQAAPPEVEPPAARYRPTGAVAHAAVQAARDLGARVVAVWTATGATVRMVARHRLPVPVVGLTYNERVYRQLSLLFGVVPIRVEPIDDPARMAERLDQCLLERRLVLPGDLVIVVTSRRPQTPGATDTALVHRVAERPAT